MAEAVDPRWLESRLAPTARGLGLEIDQPEWVALAAFATRLLQWAERINLTGARDATTLADEHLADALPLLPQLPQGARVLDVGSGAGLPGLVIALLRPDLEVWLVEPRERRHAFLRACLRDAGLPTARALRMRADELLAWKERPGADVAVSRAVWPPLRWLETGPQLVRAGGRVLALEGREPVAALPPGARRVHAQVAGRTRTILVLDVS